jgi:hypothetical protein
MAGGTFWVRLLRHYTKKITIERVESSPRTLPTLISTRWGLGASHKFHISARHLFETIQFFPRVCRPPLVPAPHRLMNMYLNPGSPLC